MRTPVRPNPEPPERDGARSDGCIRPAAAARRWCATAVTLLAALTGCGDPGGPDGEVNVATSAATAAPAPADTGATGAGPAATSAADADDAADATDADAAAAPSSPSVEPGAEEAAPDSQLPDWVPTEAELDRMAIAAEQAYREHWKAYDAAARTGFADPDLQEALLATATSDTLEALQLQAAALAGTGRTVAGVSEVLGMEPIGLDPPVDGGLGITVVFDACVTTAGTLREADGTVVRNLDWDEGQFLRVRVADHAGTWLVVSQQGLKDSCPAGFGGAAGGG